MADKPNSEIAREIWKLCEYRGPVDCEAQIASILDAKDEAAATALAEVEAELLSTRLDLAEAEKEIVELDAYGDRLAAARNKKAEVD